MDIEARKLEKVKLLSELMWDRKAHYDAVLRWINGVANIVDLNEKDVSNMLYTLEHFIFFNEELVTTLIKALYRDSYQYEIISSIRRANSDTLDEHFIESKLKDELLKTRFVGVGSASESGTYLLYDFRKKNNLGKDLFIDVHQILRNNALDDDTIIPELQNTNITRYVFIDDFCGTGDQCSKYLDKISTKIKQANENIIISYFCLVGTQTGISYIENNTPKIDTVKSVMDLDKSFKIFENNSRYYLGNYPTYFTDIDQGYFKHLCKKFASSLNLELDLWYGYKNSQLLIAFHHNTPDNTLPLFWYSKEDRGVYPIFKRDDKKYTES